LCNVTASLLVIAVLVVQVPPEAYADPGSTATTYTVNTTSDSGDGTCDADECTLREAINAANKHSG
jgi:CSLREA domain-containing protein